MSKKKKKKGAYFKKMDKTVIQSNSLVKTLGH